VLHLIVEPERREKTLRIMSSLGRGWGEPRKLCEGVPPDDGEPFLVWGQLWTALAVIPDALKQNRPFWHIDNGFYKSAGGRETGYYRFAYRGMTPILLPEPDYTRADQIAPDAIKPWRKSGRHILIAMPSVHYGRAIGIDTIPWMHRILRHVRMYSDRPVIVRTKESREPLEAQVRDAWALVTHSSNTAVEAARLGIPVFVEPTSAAAPVGNLRLDNLESPAMPDNRRQWFSSLLMQQFSLAEMQAGVAFKYLCLVREMMDGK
jgi:hypothetical protein